MWTNPKYAGQLPGPDQAEPPRDEGEVLAVLPRAKGEELRIALAEFNGFQFISLRVWEPGSDGRLVPLKGKGCTIKLREIIPVGQALARALEMTGGRLPARPRLDAPARGHGQGANPDGSGPRRRGDVRSDWRQAELPGQPAGSGNEFDECAR